MIISKFTVSELRAQGYVEVTETTRGSGVSKVTIASRSSESAVPLLEGLQLLGAPVLIPRGGEAGVYCVKGWMRFLAVEWPFDKSEDPDLGLLKRVIRLGMVEQDGSTFAASVITIARLGDVAGVRSFFGDRLEGDLLDALADQGIKPEWGTR